MKAELTPVVSGLQSPHGMAFVKTVDDDDDAALEQSEEWLSNTLSKMSSPTPG